MSSEISFVRIARKSAKNVSRYRNNLEKYLDIVKTLAIEHFGFDVKVYLFGSVLRGDYRPLSDIDVAVVLEMRPPVGERAAFRSKLRDELGLFHPFEIHIVSREDWEGWYKRFIERYREV